MLDRESRDLFALRANPMFEYERRMISWAKDASSLIQYRKTVWLSAALISLAVWLGLTIYNNNEASFHDRLLLLAICVSVILMVVVDLYSTFTVASYLHPQIRSGQWELLNLSPQQDTSILQAYFTIAQVRAWRPAVWEVAARIAVTELMVWGILRLFITFHFSASDLFSFATWVVLTPVGIFLFVYLIEPMWRMKALAALNLAVVSRTRSIGNAYLALFGATLIIHVLQIASLAVVWRYFTTLPDDYFGFGAILCGIPIDAILAICGTYLLYRFLKQRALAVALKRMFAPAD